MERIFNFLIKLIITPLYYLVLTPLGILIRLTGTDYMKKSFDKTGKSYWLDQPQKDGQ